jgi:PKD repeat protein
MCKNVTVTLSGGAASVTAAQIDNGSSDACGIASMSVSPSSFNCTNIGANTVTLTVTDNNGNSSTCTATVTVVGTIPTVANITVTPSNNIYTGGVPTNIYLGYGPQSASLTTSASGGSSFSYAWFSGSALSCTNCQTTTFAPTTQGSYSKTVTATNNYGCTASKSITLCVFNIVAPGGSPSNPKVYLCHVPPGNSNNPQTLNISVNAVPAHLGNHAGDRLGSCAASCANLATAGATGDMYSDVTSMGEVDLVVYPNPSSGAFNFIVESSYDAPVTIQVVDVTGKVIITQNNLPHNVEFSIGESLPQGIYFAKVQQGEFTKVVRIVKVN